MAWLRILPHRVGPFFGQIQYKTQSNPSKIIILATSTPNSVTFGVNWESFQLSHVNLNHVNQNSPTIHESLIGENRVSMIVFSSSDGFSYTGVEIGISLRFDNKYFGRSHFRFVIFSLV